jgi:hypothetical protein
MTPPCESIRSSSRLVGALDPVTSADRSNAPDDNPNVPADGADPDDKTKSISPPDKQYESLKNILFLQGSMRNRSAMF